MAYRHPIEDIETDLDGEETEENIDSLIDEELPDGLYPNDRLQRWRRRPENRKHFNWDEDIFE